LTPAKYAIAGGPYGKDVKTMTDEAREARNAYRREWYRKNKDKHRQQQERYWQRKAQSDRQKTAENGRKDEEMC